MADGEENNEHQHQEIETPAEDKEMETFEDAQDDTAGESATLQHTEETQPRTSQDNHHDPNPNAHSEESQQPEQSTQEGDGSKPGENALSEPMDATDEHLTEKPLPKNPIETAPNLPPPTQGLSGELPAVQYPPPPPSGAQGPTATTEKPGVSRTPSEGIRGKMSTGFSWFRGMRKTSASPSRANLGVASRRGTASSVATLGSNPDTLSAIKDDRSGVVSPMRSASGSLQDRFHQLRMQEEMGDLSQPQIPEGDEAPSSPAGQASEPTSPPLVKRSESQNKVQTNVNNKLPPGTASGMSMGPSAEDGSSVNWDLWQNLVFEGPAAVAKTSGEELNIAIQNGIPQPIRGVVWQVLANSKNEDLEILYRELVARGTDQALKSPPISRAESTTQVNGTEESIASSASSIKSQASTPATAHSQMPTSPGETPNETITKASQSLNVTKVNHVYDDTKQIDKLEKTIKKDLGARTNYSKFVASAGLQDGLFGLCKAYALYDEAVGYAQGMNFIAMPLLFNMPEEEAFTLFVRIMSKYDLRSMFTAEMTGLHLRLYQFERLLEDFEPALYCHLNRRNVSPTLYATQWFLTLFAYRFPLQLVLRIYDLILSDGLSAILRFGIVLMQKNSEALLAMKDMSQLTTFLKEKIFDVYIDKSPSASSILESGFFGSTGGVDKEVYQADALVRDACAIEITADTLAMYTAEFEEKTRMERDRENELENLRTTNASMVVKVRNLEERAQQHDIEHVGIASELVRTKVENESLSDMNESLKVQVDELRKMVEDQPAEVEARLKSEMERIMARNMEVQNQNRSLEDDMSAMEQELISVKMESAQNKEENDALKQKLATIQNMIGGK